MRVTNGIIDKIDTYLNKLGIPNEIFWLSLSVILLIYFVYDTKKIDKNEKFFKILFSSKYDEDFGGKIIGSYNKRHLQILFIFSSLIGFAICMISAIIYIINNYY